MIKTGGRDGGAAAKLLTHDFCRLRLALPRNHPFGIDAHTFVFRVGTLLLLLRLGANFPRSVELSRLKIVSRASLHTLLYGGVYSINYRCRRALFWLEKGDSFAPPDPPIGLTINESELSRLFSVSKDLSDRPRFA